MRYSIGDVSRILGMTTTALHFYEKEGIITPTKEASGRRYYQEADVQRLISAKKYRSIGVSVRDIAAQFSSNGMNGKQVIDRMQQRRDDIARSITQQQGLVKDLDLLINLSHAGLEQPGQVDIRRTEDMLLFRATSCGRIPRDHLEQTVTRRWLDAMPAVSLSISQDSPDAPALPSLIVPAHRAADFGLNDQDPATSLLPGCMALHAVVTCGDEQYETPEIIFAPLVDFAQAHNFRQAGVMWGRVLFADCSCGGCLHYYDVFMPIA